jgi:hypothetical protein
MHNWLNSRTRNFWPSLVFPCCGQEIHSKMVWGGLGLSSLSGSSALRLAVGPPWYDGVEVQSVGIAYFPELMQRTNLQK